MSAITPVNEYHWEAIWKETTHVLCAEDDGKVETAFQERKRTAAGGPVMITVSGERLVADLQDFTIYTEDEEDVEIGSVSRVCKPASPYDPELFIEELQFDKYKSEDFAFRAAWRCGSGYQIYTKEESDQIIKYLRDGVTEGNINGIHKFQHSDGCYFQCQIEDPSKQRDIRVFAIKWQYLDPKGNPSYERNEEGAHPDDWADYSPENSLICELKYLEGASSTTITASGVEYIVDLYTMHQYRCNSHYYRRQIRRIGCPILAEFCPVRTEPSYPFYWPNITTTESEQLPGESLPPLRLVELPKEYREIYSFIENTMNTFTGLHQVFGTVPGTTSQPTKLEVVRVDVNANTRIFRSYFFHKSGTPTHPVDDAASKRLKEIFRPPAVHPMELETDKNEYYLLLGVSSKSIPDICRNNFNSKNLTESTLGLGLQFADTPYKPNLHADCPVCGRGSIGSRMLCCCTANTDEHVFQMLFCRVQFNNFLIVDDTMHQELSDSGEFLTRPPAEVPQKYDSYILRPGTWSWKDSDKMRQEVLRSNEVHFGGRNAVRCIFPEFVVHYKRLLA